MKQAGPADESTALSPCRERSSHRERPYKSAGVNKSGRGARVDPYPRGNRRPVVVLGRCAG